MKNKLFYIVMSAVLALCILGACITAPDDEPSSAQPSDESSEPQEESSEPPVDVSEPPVLPPDPNKYSDVTDAALGADEIDAYFNLSLIHI